MKQRKQLKQYKKHLNKLFAFYESEINKINKTQGYKELMTDIQNIERLIRYKRLKDINIILDNISFIYFVKRLINWYVKEWDDKHNTVLYDYKLHKIKTKRILRKITNFYY